MTVLRELVLELTERCPQNCLHCSSASGPFRQEHLPLAVALRLVHEARDLGAERVSFGGGEPFESPVLPEVVREVSKLGMAAQVFTCGAVGSGHGLAALADEAIQGVAAVPSVEFAFSVHGCDAATHDLIAQTPGSFARMLLSLGKATALGVPCEFNFVPVRPNVGQFAGVVRLAARQGIPRISVLRFVPQGRGMANRASLELTAAEEDRFIGSLLALRKKHEVQIRTGSPFNGVAPDNAVPCRAGASKLVIQADGNVLPCEVYKAEGMRDWGLSAEARTLREMLESPQLARLRRQVQRDSCLLCPVHSALRATSVRSEHEQLPHASLRARAG